MRYLVSLVTMAAWAWSAPTTTQPLTIDKVGWLQGCWQLSSGQRVVEEQWMAPRAKSMLGMGRTVRGDTLVEYRVGPDQRAGRAARVPGAPVRPARCGLSGDRCDGR